MDCELSSVCLRFGSSEVLMVIVDGDVRGVAEGKCEQLQVAEM